MIVYSNNCPRCKVLIKKLEQKGINFNKVESEDEIMRVANEHNIQSTPFILLEDGTLMLFEEAIRYINSL